MPASADARSGNRHTAHRWAGFLRNLGHRVAVTYDWAGSNADILIALHARKSYASIEKFHRLRPDAPLIVTLTGTDLYRDIHDSREAQHALELATRLIVLQERGIRELPRQHRSKTRVIYQSAAVNVRHAPASKNFRVAVVGHLRQEKDPFRAVSALKHLRQDANIEVIQLGAALTPDMASEAEHWMQCEPRYRWLGSKPHAQTLRMMAGCHVLVVSSVMEGGANVICEAARIGVPVIASRVSGNVGMLGNDYPGYFTLSDESRLARLIVRAADDTVFYGKLKQGIKARKALFAPSAERRGLQQLLRDIQRDKRFR